jgi:hypothetical protein
MKSEHDSLRINKKFQKVDSNFILNASIRVLLRVAIIQYNLVVCT